MGNQVLKEFISKNQKEKTSLKNLADQKLNLSSLQSLQKSGLDEKNNKKLKTFLQKYNGIRKQDLSEAKIEELSYNIRERTQNMLQELDNKQNEEMFRHLNENEYEVNQIQYIEQGAEDYFKIITESNCGLINLYQQVKNFLNIEDNYITKYLKEQQKKKKSSNKVAELGIKAGIGIIVGLLQESKDEEVKYKMLHQIYELIVNSKGGVLFGLNQIDLLIDRSVSQFQQFLVNLLEEKNQRESVIKISLKLMLRLAILKASLSDILLSIVQINKHNQVDLDLESELELLNKKQSKQQMSFQKMDQENKQTINCSQVLMNENPFKNNEIQSNMCSDGDYLYVYNSKGGLSKYSLNDKDGRGQLMIENSQFQSEKITNGCLLMIQNMLYFRCKGVFMYIIDKTSLQIQSEVSQENVETTGYRVLWKEQCNNQQISYMNNDENNKSKLRSTEASYAFSDNRYLYIMSEEVVEEKEQEEIFEEDQEDEFTNKQEQQLIYVIDKYEYIQSQWKFKNYLVIQNNLNKPINLKKESLKQANFICNGRYILSTKPFNDKLTNLNFSAIDLNTGILYTKEEDLMKKMVIKVPTNASIICWDDLNQRMIFNEPSSDKITLIQSTHTFYHPQNTHSLHNSQLINQISDQNTLSSNNQNYHDDNNIDNYDNNDNNDIKNINDNINNTDKKKYEFNQILQELGFSEQYLINQPQKAKPVEDKNSDQIEINEQTIQNKNNKIVSKILTQICRISTIKNHISMNGLKRKYTIELKPTTFENIYKILSEIKKSKDQLSELALMRILQLNLDYLLMTEGLEKYVDLFKENKLMQWVSKKAEDLLKIKERTAIESCLLDETVQIIFSNLDKTYSAEQILQIDLDKLRGQYEKQYHCLLQFMSQYLHIHKLFSNNTNPNKLTLVNYILSLQRQSIFYLINNQPHLIQEQPQFAMDYIFNLLQYTIIQDDHILYYHLLTKILDLEIHLINQSLPKLKFVIKKDKPLVENVEESKTKNKDTKDSKKIEKDKKNQDKINEKQNEKQQGKKEVKEEENQEKEQEEEEEEEVQKDRIEVRNLIKGLTNNINQQRVINLVLKSMNVLSENKNLAVLLIKKLQEMNLLYNKMMKTIKEILEDEKQTRNFESKHPMKMKEKDKVYRIYFDKAKEIKVKIQNKESFLKEEEEYIEFYKDIECKELITKQYSGKLILNDKIKEKVDEKQEKTEEEENIENSMILRTNLVYMKIHQENIIDSQSWGYHLELECIQDNTIDQQINDLKERQREINFLVGKMSLVLVQINNPIKVVVKNSSNNVEESISPIEEQNVLKNRLLEGGLEYNILEKKKDEICVVEQSLENLGNDELQRVVNINDKRGCKDNQFLLDLIHKKEGVHYKLIEDLQKKLKMECAWLNLGGETGELLTRCAFVVIIKHSNLLSELINSLSSLTPIIHKKWAIASKMRQFYIESKTKFDKQLEQSNNTIQQSQTIQKPQSQSQTQKYPQSQQDDTTNNDTQKKKANKNGNQNVIQEVEEVQNNKIKIKKQKILTSEEHLERLIQQVISKSELLIYLNPGFNNEDENNNSNNKLKIYKMKSNQNIIQQQEEHEDKIEWKNKLDQWKIIRQKDNIDMRIAEEIYNTHLNVSNSVLYILQSKVSSKKIQNQLFNTQKQGMLRVKGLQIFVENIISQNEEQLWLDQLQQLFQSLRKNENKLYSLRVGLESVGEQINYELDLLFQRLLQNIVMRLKDNKEGKQILSLLEALKWQFQGKDFRHLINIEIFSVLEQQLESMHEVIQSQCSLSYEQLSDEHQLQLQTIYHVFSIFIVQSLCKQDKLNQNTQECQTHSLKLRRQLTNSNESTIDEMLSHSFAVIFNQLKLTLNNYTSTPTVNHNLFQRYQRRIKNKTIFISKQKDQQQQSQQGENAEHNDNQDHIDKGLEDQDQIDINNNYYISKQDLIYYEILITQAQQSSPILNQDLAPSIPDEKESSHLQSNPDDNVQIIDDQILSKINSNSQQQKEENDKVESKVQEEDNKKEKENQKQKEEEQKDKVQNQKEEDQQEDNKKEEDKKEEQKEEEKEEEKEEFNRNKKLKEIIESEEQIINDYLKKIRQVNIVKVMLILVYRSVNSKQDQIQGIIGSPNNIKILLDLIQVANPNHVIIIVKILKVLMKQMPKYIKELMNKDKYMSNILFEKLKAVEEHIFKEHEKKMEVQEYVIKEEITNLLNSINDEELILEKLESKNIIENILAVNMMGSNINGIRKGQEVIVNESENSKKESVLMKQTLIQNKERKGVVVGFTEENQEITKVESNYNQVEIENKKGNMALVVFEDDLVGNRSITDIKIQMVSKLALIPVQRNFIYSDRLSESVLYKYLNIIQIPFKSLQHQYLLTLITKLFYHYTLNNFPLIFSPQIYYHIKQTANITLNDQTNSNQIKNQILYNIFNQAITNQYTLQNHHSFITLYQTFNHYQLQFTIFHSHYKLSILSSYNFNSLSNYQVIQFKSYKSKTLKTNKAYLINSYDFNNLMTQYQNQQESDQKALLIQYQSILITQEVDFSKFISTETQYKFVIITLRDQEFDQIIEQIEIEKQKVKESNENNIQDQQSSNIEQIKKKLNECGINEKNNSEYKVLQGDKLDFFESLLLISKKRTIRKQEENKQIDSDEEMNQQNQQNQKYVIEENEQFKEIGKEIVQEDKEEEQKIDDINRKMYELESLNLDIDKMKENNTIFENKTNIAQESIQNYQSRIIIVKKCLEDLQIRYSLRVLFNLHYQEDIKVEDNKQTMYFEQVVKEAIVNIDIYQDNQLLSLIISTIFSLYQLPDCTKFTDILNSVISQIDSISTHSNLHIEYILFVIQQFLRINHNHTTPIFQLLFSKTNTLIQQIFLKIINTNTIKQKGFIHFIIEFMNYVLQNKIEIQGLDSKTTSLLNQIVEQTLQKNKSEDNKKESVDEKSQLMMECLIIMMKIQKKMEVSKEVYQLYDYANCLQEYPLETNLLIEQMLDSNKNIKDNYRLKIHSNQVYKSITHTLKVDCSLFDKVNIRLKDYPKNSTENNYGQIQVSSDPDCTMNVRKCLQQIDFTVQSSHIYLHFNHKNISYAFGYNQQANTSLFHKINQPFHQLINYNFYLKDNLLMHKSSRFYIDEQDKENIIKYIRIYSLNNNIIILQRQNGVFIDFINTKENKTIHNTNQNRPNYYYVKIVHDKNNVCYALTNDKKLFQLQKHQDQDEILKQEVNLGIEYKDYEIQDVFCGDDFQILMIVHKINKSVKIVGRGDQKYGVLGNGNNSGIVNSFKQLKQLQEKRLKQIWVKNQSLIGCSTDGQYFAWGRNQFGQLCLEQEDSSIDEVTTPQLINYFSANQLTLIHIIQGQNSTLFQANHNHKQQFYYVGENDNNIFKMKDKKSKTKISSPLLLQSFLNIPVSQVQEQNGVFYFKTKKQSMVQKRDHFDFKCQITNDNIVNGLYYNFSNKQSYSIQGIQNYITSLDESIIFIRQNQSNLIGIIQKIETNKDYFEFELEVSENNRKCSETGQIIEKYGYVSIFDNNQEKQIYCQKYVEEIQQNNLNPDIFYYINLEQKQKIKIYQRQHIYNMNMLANNYSIEIECIEFNETGKKTFMEREKETLLKINKDMDKHNIQELDEEIVEQVNQQIIKKELDPFASEDFEIPKEIMQAKKHLKNKSQEQIKSRLKIIKLLNKKVKELIKYINFSVVYPNQENRLISIYQMKSKLIFQSVKDVLINDILTKSEQKGERLSVNINRMKASTLLSQNKTDIYGEISLFGQLFQQIFYNVCKQTLGQNSKPFRVEFLGEGSIDAGGPFNECLSQMSKELQSRQLPIFIPSPNQKANNGQHRDKFILDPNCNSTVQIEMLQFLGAMMGSSIRTKNYLDLNLPSYFWKQLAGQTLCKLDLEHIDKFSIKCLDEIINIDKRGVNESNFEDYIDEHFTTCLSNGVEVELINQGKQKKVTFHNRLDYVDLVIKKRMSESIDQINAVRQGLFMIIPNSVVNIMNWQELEISICGEPNIDVDLLKTNTEYENCNANTPIIVMFWKMINEFNNIQRSNYLRFVYGRSRLPLCSKDFQHKHTIVATHYQNESQELPQSHTCFFQLDLPQYITYNMLKKKMLYAITFCQDIDTDNDPQYIDVWQEEENQEEDE